MSYLTNDYFQSIPSLCPCDPKLATGQATNSCPGDATTSSGCNSVRLSTGQFVFNLPLLSISSVGGIGWGFGLNYLSGSQIDDVLGAYFNFPQQMHLEFTDGGAGINLVDVVTGQTTVEMFEETSGNSNIYVPSPGNNSRAQLAVVDPGMSTEEFVLTSAAGVVTTFYGFDSSIAAGLRGKLKSIEDRYGSHQTYGWTEVDTDVYRLTSVTDSYGRTVTYTYDNASPYRLIEIEDFLERKLNFTYDANDRLESVVTPSINRAAEGNTFPGGTAYVFAYKSTSDLIEKIWYPNECAPYVNDDRTVDISGVKNNATPRYTVAYDGSDRVIKETVGDDPTSPTVGGSYTFSYDDSPSTTNLIDGSDPIVDETTVTDRNGNERVYSFTQAGMVARLRVKRNRDKINIPSTGTFPQYDTWTAYDGNNLPIEVVYPEGNTIEYEYDDGMVDFGSGDELYNPRVGLLLQKTRKPGNTISIPSRSGSSGQTELTRRFFYDPLFNQQIAVIEERGNPIASGPTYFTPQNGGTTPTNSDRSRYATISILDYQKNTQTNVEDDTDLQALLGLTSAEIGYLIDHVDDQMKATDGTGGLPDGFQMDLGDINGDGTGNGNSSGLDPAKILGNVVKVKHPDVRLIGSSSITTQVRVEIFTYNDRGQQTTHTDPEGNLTVIVRYPDNDPEGDGQFIATGLSSKQYGRVKEVRGDADPNDVMSLVGADGDLVDFIPDIIARTNTPGVYQNLITRYEGSKIGAGGGCAACAYDPLGNPLAVTDPRGFTTRYDRNELGEAFRTTSPDPYRYRVETHFDANRNVIRIDTEDKFVLFDSSDPADAGYGHIDPSGSGFVAQVPTQSGNGGSTRPGWFTDLMTYDLLDNLVEEDRDATGSDPDRLVSTHEYDPNQNRIKSTKPEGNTVEYDYDERDLQIAVRAGNSPDTPADTVTAYDANGNILQVIGPAQRGSAGNHQTVTLENAFGSASQLVHTGDFVLENTYDGFDRVVETKDAAGNVVDAGGTLGDPCYDPGGRLIKSTSQGPVGGATPSNRSGTNNVDLSESFVRYDEAGRAYEQQQPVFVANTTGSGALPSARDVSHSGGGLATNSTANDHTASATIYNTGGANESSYVLTRTVFDRTGRAVETVADNTAVTANEFDGANRRVHVVDPAGNEVLYAYDANSNLVYQQRIERPTITDPLGAVEVFEAAMRYDSLNRLVASAQTNPIGVAS